MEPLISVGSPSRVRTGVAAVAYRGRYIRYRDSVSLATRRSPIRARDEMCLFILGAREKTAHCTCEPAVAGKDLRGVCMCIDLVFSYSIDATNCLFAESDAPEKPIFSTGPLTGLGWLMRCAEPAR